MFKFLILSSFLISHLFCSAQDTIVTTKGDIILADVQSFEVGKKITYFNWGSEFYRFMNDSKIKEVRKDRNRSDLSRDIISKTEQECYFDGDEIDKKGERNLRSYGEVCSIYFGIKLTISFQRLKSEYFMRLMYYNGTLNKVDVEKDAPFLLTLRNDAEIQMSSTDNFSSETIYSIEFDKYIKWGQATYKISQEQINQIMSNGIKKVKISFTGGFVDHDIEAKDSKKVEKLAYCILITK